MQDIYNDIYFKDSALYDYIDSFYTGYSLDSYQYASECKANMTSFLDSLHDFKINVTATANAEGDTTKWNQYLMVMGILGYEFNDAWFYCYQFGKDVGSEYKTKGENFVDFGDFYLSFIFNLLSNSLQIKVATEKMITAVDSYDTSTMCFNMGVIARIMFDFDSY